MTTDGWENCFGSKTAGNGPASATFEKWAGMRWVVADDESRFAPQPIRNRLAKNKPTRNDFVIEISPSVMIGFQF